MRNDYIQGILFDRNDFVDLSRRGKGRLTPRNFSRRAWKQLGDQLSTATQAAKSLVK